MEHIPDELYREIINAIPFVCVDIVIKNGNSFFLAKRKSEPAQGQWFLPGGRVLKNEKLEDAAYQKVQQETGLNVKIEKILGVDETMFPVSTFGVPTHSVNVVFLATTTNPETTVHLDNQNDEYQWYTHIDDVWHPYVKKFLKLAWFKEIDQR